MGLPLEGIWSVPLQSLEHGYERDCKCWAGGSVDQMPPNQVASFFFCGDPRLPLYFLSAPLLKDFVEWNCPCVCQEFGCRKCFQNMGPEKKGRSKWPNKFCWVGVCHLWGRQGRILTGGCSFSAWKYQPLSISLFSFEALTQANYKYILKAMCFMPLRCSPEISFQLGRKEAVRLFSDPSKSSRIATFIA